jgi:hypothetical protein
MSTSGFQQVAELASHLSPEEQIQLILRIQRQLPASAAGTVSDDAPGGLPVLVLRAIEAPPHVGSGDVDALEQAIAESKIPMGQHGIFDEGD